MHDANPSKRLKITSIHTYIACTLFHNILNSFVELVRYLFTLDGVKTLRKIP